MASGERTVYTLSWENLVQCKELGAAMELQGQQRGMQHVQGEHSRSALLLLRGAWEWARAHMHIHHTDVGHGQSGRWDGTTENCESHCRVRKASLGQQEATQRAVCPVKTLTAMHTTRRRAGRPVAVSSLPCPGIKEALKEAPGTVHGVEDS